MQKAIILQNKYIGDVLVASLLAKNLKRIIPDVEVHFFCYDKAVPILENNPYIDKIIHFDDNRLKKISVLSKYALQIRKEKYDILIDPYSKLQSRFITFLSGAKMRISYDKPFFKYLYNYRIREKKRPEYVCCTSIENRLRLLEPLDPQMSDYDFQTEVFLSENEKKNAIREFQEKGIDFNLPIMMIGVLGSSEEKSLPAPQMGELINYLIENYEANFILNYIPNQQPHVDEILTFVEKPGKLHQDILGNNVRELLAILSQTNVLIGNEGGAINMAKALKVPTYSIFSPHKFREDWSCYENQAIHQSFHLQDQVPEYLYKLDLKKTIKNPKKLYLQYDINFLKENLNVYLSNIGIKSKSPAIVKKPKEFIPKISALLITKNEEKNIGKFLEDVDFADEIIIIDSHSTDNTKQIATQNNKVTFLERKFDNFSNQKNFAIEKANYPWIVFFDTDERISRELKAEILYNIKRNSQFDAFFIRRKFYFLERPMHYSGLQNDKAIRLFKNGKCRYGDHKFVHETLMVDGKVGLLKEQIDHYSLSNLTSYQRKLNLYAKLKAKELFLKNKKPNFFHYKIKPIFRFMQHYVFRFGFLDGKNGYIIAAMYKNYVAKRYFYLDRYWEASEKKNVNP